MLKLRIFLTAWLAIAVSSPAFADADGPDFFAVTGVSSGDVLNIRSGPSATETKLGEIPADGNGIRNLGCVGGLSYAEWEAATPEEREQAKRTRWCQVEYAGVTGWAAGWFLTEGNAPDVAQGPAFDCGKADGEIEELICADPMLGQLDRELARLYTLAAATPDMDAQRLSDLKAYQRGWIKGRNDCWKATVDKAACVSDSYALRIAELRTGYANARTQDAAGISTGPFAYACDGLDALISAGFIQSDPPLLTLMWRDQVHVLSGVPSGSGGKYEDARSGTIFWTKGSEATLSRAGQADLTCRIEETG